MVNQGDYSRFFSFSVYLKLRILTFNVLCQFCFCLFLDAPGAPEGPLVASETTPDSCVLKWSAPKVSVLVCFFIVTPFILLQTLHSNIWALTRENLSSGVGEQHRR